MCPQATEGEPCLICSDEFIIILSLAGFELEYHAGAFSGPTSWPPCGNPCEIYSYEKQKYKKHTTSIFPSHWKFNQLREEYNQCDEEFSWKFCIKLKSTVETFGLGTTTPLSGPAGGGGFFRVWCRREDVSRGPKFPAVSSHISIFHMSPVKIDEAIEYRFVLQISCD